MFLKYVQIVNFRNLKEAKFCFAEGANTIIGENDAGKSNAVNQRMEIIQRKDKCKVRLYWRRGQVHKCFFVLSVDPLQ